LAGKRQCYLHINDSHSYDIHSYDIHKYVYLDDAHSDICDANIYRDAGNTI